MKKLWIVLGLVFCVGTANATPMQDVSYPTQSSTAAEGSHVFKQLNTAKIKVTWASATTARWLCVFDGTAVPSNGSTTSCSSSRTTGCLAWSGFMQNSTSAPAEQWFDWGYYPMHNVFGTVAVVSTTECGSITADGSNDKFFYQGQ